ncbi:MAG TPA: hypothetical protein VGG19_16490 [Tepidisphaeraceae bacterium]
MTSTPNKASLPKRFLATLLNALLFVFLIVVGVAAVLLWSDYHALRKQRRELIAEISNPGATTRLTNSVQPFFSCTLAPYNQFSDRDQEALSKNLRWFSSHIDAVPIFDNTGHISGIVLMCGGHDDYFGLIITSTTRPPNYQSYIMRQLAAHVWFWDDAKHMPTP